MFPINKTTATALLLGSATAFSAFAQTTTAPMVVTPTAIDAGIAPAANSPKTPVVLTRAIEPAPAAIEKTTISASEEIAAEPAPQKMAKTLVAPAAPVAAPIPIAPPMAMPAPEAPLAEEASIAQSADMPDSPTASTEHAPAASPITFAKDQIVLLPAKPLIESLKDGALFQVEIKSSGNAMNPDWFQLSGFPANHGLLLTYDHPQIININPANILAHYDVIAANQYGEIVMILPNIVLANLAGTIQTPEVANTVLYVAGGTTSDIGLQVGDHLQHSMFLARTQVIDHVYETPSGVAQVPVQEAPPQTAAAPEAAPQTAEPSATAVAEPEIVADPNGRRRPPGNPEIAKPQAPKAPTAPTSPQVAKPNAPHALSTTEPTAGVSNSNLQQAPEVIPPVKSSETPAQKSLLDMILKQNPQ